MNQAGKGQVVTLRYILSNKKGEQLENTMIRAPTAYLHGSAAILPELQQQLEGMSPKHSKTFIVGKQNTGAAEDLVMAVVIDEVRDASEEELLLGYPVTNPCDAGCICYINQQP